jgi:ribosomal protein S18 acetylase RimI-like enzyme
VSKPRLSIRTLVEADLADAQRLRAQAGWNQPDDDWRRLLAWDRDGCWAAEADGRVVGTTAVTTYGRRIAWIGMVLVDVEHRRKGIGRALLAQAIEYLDRLGVETVALDSTPAGQALYARLGFVVAFELERRRGVARPPRPVHANEAAAMDGPEVRPFAPDDLATVAAYDAQRFGVERAHILGALRTDHPARCFVAARRERISGYVLSRPGASAWHLGPLVADDPVTAERLAWAALLPDGDDRQARAVGGEAVMDVVVPNVHAVALVDALGLAPVRPFIRMVRGATPPAVDTGRLYTSAGPELG